MGVEENKKDPGIIIRAWVNLYSDKLYSWCLHKTGSKEIGEDLVQDTFMAAFGGMNKFEGKSDPKTWLFSILNHKIADYFRKLYRNPTITEGGIKQSSEAPFFETYFDADGSWLKEQRPATWPQEDAHLPNNAIFVRVLQTCMGKLPPDCYTAIQLMYFEEKKGEIICQELQIIPTNF